MISDELLVERLLQGDLAALDALYDRYARHLFGFIVGQLGDRGEAEDVLHDTFLAVLMERQAGRRAPDCFRAWIYQVARNLCLKRVRARQRASRAMLAAAQGLEEAPEQPERMLDASESMQALQRALGRLPAPLAEVFRLRASGLSYEELAHVLQVPVGTIKSRMHERVSRLRAEVQR